MPQLQNTAKLRHALMYGMEVRIKLNADVQEAEIDLAGAATTLDEVCAKADRYDQLYLAMNTIKVIAANPISDADFVRIHVIATAVLSPET